MKKAPNITPRDTRPFRERLEDSGSAPEPREPDPPVKRRRDISTPFRVLDTPQLWERPLNEWGDPEC